MTDQKLTSKSPEISGPHSRAVVLWGLILLNALVGSGVVWLLWQERNRAINDARLESIGLVRLLERDVRFKLQLVSSILDSIGGRIERAMVGHDGTRWILGETMEHDLQRASIVQRFAAFNVAGDQVCRPPPADCPQISVKDRSYFLYFQNNPSAKPQLFGPFQSRLDGKMAMYMARALQDGHGNFLGVVIAVVPLNALGQVIQGAQIGPQGAVSLRTADLALLARRPELPSDSTATKVDMVSETLRQLVHRASEFGTYIATTANDGIDRQTAYQRVDGFPLYVIHGQAIEDYLLSWNRFAFAVLGLMAAMALFSAGIYRYFQLSVRREAEVNRLYDTAPCGYATLNASGMITNINVTGLQWLGAQRADVVGCKTLADFLTPASQTAFKSSMEQLGNVGRFGGVELDMLSAGSTHRRVVVNAELRKGTDGKWDAGSVVIFDISELHIARQNLVKLAQQQAVMLDTDLIAIVKLKDRQVLWANKGSDRIFGYSGSEWMNLPTRSLHLDDRTYIQEGEASYAAMNSGGTYTTQIQMVRKDGSTVWIDVRGVALAGEAGTYLMMWSDVSAVRDAAERRLEALALSAQNAHLAEEGRLKQLLLSNMAHELRTPLNAVIGFSQLIRMSAQPQRSNQIEEQAESIEQSGRQLLQIIDGILDFAQLQAGHLSFFPQEVLLADVVQDVIQILRPGWMRREVTINVDIDAAPTSVIIDPVRLRQVLLQLIDNAVKFSHQQGKVIVRVVSAADSRFRIDVIDQGVGIALEDQERIWSSLTQLSTGMTKTHGGTGIGLALVAKLVEAQGGSVGVISEKDVGSTFTVNLPMQPSQPLSTVH